MQIVARFYKQRYIETWTCLFVYIYIKRSKRIPEKHLLLLHWLHYSLWLCGSLHCGKLLKRWEYQSTLLASWEICMKVKKQQLERDMEYQTGSKLGKDYNKAVYCHCLFNLHAEHIMWNIGLDESQAEIKISRKNINNLRYADDTILMAEREEELKSLLMKMKEGSRKAGLKLNMQETKSVSYMIIYMFQCYSLRSSQPHLLPQSPKDCSIHLYLFCCLAYRVIITIFLNSIYMC